jgi:predicted nucleic acid-binding protein
MNRVVVDAGVVAKWYLPEIYSRESALLLEEPFQLFAPDLLFSEIGNLLWKRVIKKELSQDKGLEILAALDSVPLQIWESRILLPAAFSLACLTQRTLYDSLYIALAVSTKSRLVTADKKLFNALKEGPWGSQIFWIEDLDKKDQGHR